MASDNPKQVTYNTYKVSLVMALQTQTVSLMLFLITKQKGVFNEKLKNKPHDIFGWLKM